MHSTHWYVLENYPTLLKILCIDYLPLDTMDQVLFLDCDTYWFSEPNRLFQQYNTWDIYACAEVGSRGYGHWYDPAYLDEDKLAAIASAEGLCSVAPFNTGVMLIRSDLCKSLLLLRRRFLETATRLLASYSKSEVPFSRTSLPYPSNNEWILDEVALWLTLGAIPGLKLGLLDQREVPISTLHFDAPVERRILAHYFSSQEESFFNRYPRL